MDETKVVQEIVKEFDDVYDVPGIDRAEFISSLRDKDVSEIIKDLDRLWDETCDIRYKNGKLQSAIERLLSHIRSHHIEEE